MKRILIYLYNVISLNCYLVSTCFLIINLDNLKFSNFSNFLISSLIL